MRVLYNRTLYQGGSLKEAADIYLKYLPQGINTLVSMGNSGCSIAAAMLIRSWEPLRHICFRKTPDEIRTSHSSYSGNWLYEPDCRIAVVDDFVSEGATLDRIKEEMGVHWEKVEVIMGSYIECDNRWGIPFVGVELGETVEPVLDAVTENVTDDANCVNSTSPVF